MGNARPGLRSSSVRRRDQACHHAATRIASDGSPQPPLEAESRVRVWSLSNDFLISLEISRRGGGVCTRRALLSRNNRNEALRGGRLRR